MKGLKDHKAARIEAREEAGIRGPMLHSAVGRYAYWRRTTKDFRLTEVVAYAMRVERQFKSWKEKGQREARWAGVPDAADLDFEPELSTLIVRLPLDPKVMEFLTLRPTE